MDELLNKIQESILNPVGRLSIITSRDKFLFREDVQSALLHFYDIHIVSGTSLALRIHFETIYKKSRAKFCYLLENGQLLLEDMTMNARFVEFNIKDLFGEYHVESLFEAPLSSLNLLFINKPILTLSKQETLAKLSSIKDDNPQYNTCIDSIKKDIRNIGTFEIQNVKEVCQLLAEQLLSAIRIGAYNDIRGDIMPINECFQKELSQHYFTHIIPSSPTLKPKVVSKILPFLATNFNKQDKIALVVVDGMSYWQYLLLSTQLHKIKEISIQEDIIFSWIPSVTELSRQAIFRGENPTEGYKQSPQSENKLWKQYWQRKGLLDSEIGYYYDELPEISSNITRLAYVDVDLDEKMHASSDNKDLYSLTINWSKKRISNIISKLVDSGFIVFLTTDHGNIQTEGWRSLTQEEKVGTRTSGSRSQRHIVYSDVWAKNQFLQKNENLRQYIFEKDNTISLNNEWNFSSKGCVTHGGSHILEVLIPFIQINRK